MNIMLIAGHGAGDSGATGLGYREADLTREVVWMIPDYLSPYANVTVGDTNRDWFMWLRTHNYDFTPYDYVLEVHFNSGASDPNGNGRVTGTEIYVTTSETGITVEQDILANMAVLGFTNRGVKRKNFTVISKIKQQGVSAALLEVAFIDDRDDMNLYQAKKNEIAKAIADGIAEGFGLENPTESGELTMTQYEELSGRIDDLQTKVSGAEAIYNYIDENMPEWARPTIKKLADKGWLEGDDDGLDLSEDMMRIFVVNDRAGLYD